MRSFFHQLRYLKIILALEYNLLTLKLVFLLDVIPPYLSYAERVADGFCRPDLTGGA